MKEGSIGLDVERLYPQLLELLFNCKILYDKESEQRYSGGQYYKISKSLQPDLQQTPMKYNIAELKNFINNINNIGGDEIYEYILRKIMILSCFSMNRIGTFYIINAVDSCKECLTKRVKISISDIYRKVGDNFAVSPEAVEKSIRSSIKMAWNLCVNNNPQMQIYYKFVFPRLNEEPTNKEILIHMSIQMKALEKIIEALNV